MAEAIRDGLRLEAIAADIAGDGDTALELLSFNAYDIAVLDRDIPGPTGDEIAERIVASGSGMPILMLTAADRLDDKAVGFGFAGSVPPACCSSSRRSPQPSAPSCSHPRRRRRTRLRRPRHPSAFLSASAVTFVVMRVARLTVPSLTARRSSMTTFRV